MLGAWSLHSKTTDLPHAFSPGLLSGAEKMENVYKTHVFSHTKTHVFWLPDQESMSLIVRLSLVLSKLTANTKSLLLQYIFSGGVHYCLNNYVCYKIRFHLLYDVLVVLTVWNHVIYHQISCCSPVRRQIVGTQIFQMWCSSWTLVFLKLVNASCTFFDNLSVFLSMNTFLNRFALKKSDFVFSSTFVSARPPFRELITKCLLSILYR
jgi:hypothetical protein